MMMGYLYMVGSEEMMGITPDFAKAEQVRIAGAEASVASGGTKFRHTSRRNFSPPLLLVASVGRLTSCLTPCLSG